MKQPKYLLDTCICAYILRGKFDINKRVEAVGGMGNCCISEITVAELNFGREYGKIKGGPKYKDQKLENFFADIHILPDEPAFELFGREKARLTAAGTRTEDFDLLIGCTAVVNDMILVTQNVKDFKNIDGVRIEIWID